MLKGFVSDEEKDIVRIPMKGKNLFDAATAYENLYNNGVVSGTTINISQIRNYFTAEQIGKQITISLYADKVGATRIYTRTSIAGRTVDSNSIYAGSTGTMSVTITPQSINDYWLISYGSGANNECILSNFMINSGSQALPYEPYGYQEGWEVRDNEDRILWGREDELQTATGTLPFKGYGLPLKTKSLLGNAVQNGTPAPDNVIMPEMCGVRTGNLCAIPSVSANFGDLTVAANGDTFSLTGTITTEITKSNDFWKRFDFVLSAGDYTIALGVPRSYQGGYSLYLVEYDTGTVLATISGAGATQTTFTLTNDTHVYIGFYIYNKTLSDDKWILMLNLGSTALPYEPYGWKVPFESHGENLWDKGVPKYVYANDYKKYNSDNAIALNAGTYTISSDGKLPIIQVFDTNLTQLNVDDTITYVSGYYKTWDGLAIGPQSGVVHAVTITLLSDYILTFTVSDTLGTYIMLNLGSTAKPYSPYLNETIPVYLGEVPTVRRVKKLVLTGEETWWSSGTYTGAVYAYHSQFPGIKPLTPIFCTHLVDAYESPYVQGTCKNDSNSVGLWVFDTAISPTAFKEYLAQQYANGTPVTIWYVLANEETAISNEPLCKISTYADELTTIQVHGLSAPLYGIGDYKDTLNLSTGVVTRKVKKLVLDGTEGWSENTSGTNTFRGALSLPYENMIGAGGFCSHNIYKISGISADEEACSCYRGALYFRISKTIASNVASFKQWLSQQYANGTPVTIWYVLSTPETETVTIPTGMTGEIEGYLTQVSTPTPTNRSVPKWNGVEETGGTYAVTVYTPPEIPTTTGENTLTVDTTLAPSSLTVKGHIKELT